MSIARDLPDSGNRLISWLQASSPESSQDGIGEPWHLDLPLVVSVAFDPIGAASVSRAVAACGGIMALWIST
jgi:hypothetical protein